MRIGRINWDVYPYHVELLTEHTIDEDFVVPWYTRLMLSTRTKIVRHVKKMEQCTVVEISHDKTDIGDDAELIMKHNKPYIDDFGFHLYYSIVLGTESKLIDYRYD